AGEGHLADAVDREGHVALHDEDAEQAADEAEDRGGEHAVADDGEEVAVVAEVEHLDHRRSPASGSSCTGWSWCGGWCGWSWIPRARASAGEPTQQPSAESSTMRSARRSSSSTSCVMTTTATPRRRWAAASATI